MGAERKRHIDKELELYTANEAKIVLRICGEGDADNGKLTKLLDSGAVYIDHVGGLSLSSSVIGTGHIGIKKTVDMDMQGRLSISTEVTSLGGD